MFAIKLWMWMWMCSLPNSDSFYQKINHLLKVKKLMTPVIDIGREFQILGPW